MIAISSYFTCNPQKRLSIITSFLILLIPVLCYFFPTLFNYMSFPTKKLNYKTDPEYFLRNYPFIIKKLLFFISKEKIIKISKNIRKLYKIWKIFFMNTIFFLPRIYTSIFTDDIGLNFLIRCIMTFRTLLNYFNQKETKNVIYNKNYENDKKYENYENYDHNTIYDKNYESENESEKNVIYDKNYNTVYDKKYENYENEKNVIYDKNYNSVYDKNYNTVYNSNYNSIHNTVYNSIYDAVSEQELFFIRKMANLLNFFIFMTIPHILSYLFTGSTSFSSAILFALNNYIYIFQESNFTTFAFFEIRQIFSNSVSLIFSYFLSGDWVIFYGFFYGIIYGFIFQEYSQSKNNLNKNNRLSNVPKKEKMTKILSNTVIKSFGYCEYFIRAIYLFLRRDQVGEKSLKNFFKSLFYISRQAEENTESGPRTIYFRPRRINSIQIRQSFTENEGTEQIISDDVNKNRSDLSKKKSENTGTNRTKNSVSEQNGDRDEKTRRREL